MGQTNNYGFKTIDGTDDARFSDDGYKYTSADRHLIDKLLKKGAETHVHDGATGSAFNPTLAPNLELDTSGGGIQAGVRVFYKYTLVDSDGLESLPSPEAYIDTPAQVAAPSAPGLTTATTGGTLVGGNYYYVLSAYTTVNSQETTAINPTFITVPTTTGTNTVTLDLPSLPTNATGFNVYRKAPAENTYYYIASVDMSVATPPSEYEDDGSTAPDCFRTLPSSNSTLGENSVVVTYPGATPTVPDGYTWKIYRTYVSNDYDISLLHHMIEHVLGVIDVDYTDTGEPTSTGSPPTTAQVFNNPAKINLEDATHVEGRLPMGLMAFPFTVTFAFPDDPLGTVTGETVWVCEYPKAFIVGARGALARGAFPASTSVIFDVLRGDQGATPVEATIYPTATKPTITVGQQVGTRAQPDVRLLTAGDYLTVDLTQVGGGATPTDHHATLNIYMIAYGFDEDTSYVDDTATGI